MVLGRGLEFGAGGSEVGVVETLCGVDSEVSGGTTSADATDSAWGATSGITKTGAESTARYVFRVSKGRIYQQLDGKIIVRNRRTRPDNHCLA